jgi:hypothetical protein
MKAGYRPVVVNRLLAFSAVRHLNIQRAGEKAANRLPAILGRVNL